MIQFIALKHHNYTLWNTVRLCNIVSGPDLALTSHPLI